MGGNLFIAPYASLRITKNSMSKELEARIETLERQVIDLTKALNQNQVKERIGKQLAATTTPANTKAKRVTLSDGTTVDVAFHQQWIDKNRLPNPLKPGTFISVDETFDNAEIMAYWAITKSPAYTTQTLVKITQENKD